MQLQQNKIKLAIISHTIRRDLQAPLQLFDKIDIVHFYQQAGYGDMKAEDFVHPPAVQFKNYKDLYAKLVAYQPTIVQAAEPWANQTSFLISLVVWRYTRRYQPIVVMPVFENIIVRTKLSKIKYQLCAWLIKRLDKYVAVYFALNKGARQNLESFGIPSNKISSLMWGAWGIDLKEFRIKNEEFRTKVKRILFLGRISKAKGIPILVEAFKKIRQQQKDVELVIAGIAGDAMDLIKSPGIRFIGPLKHQDLAQFFSNGNVTVMPSQTTPDWIEQVGMVGLQSLACGTPVITTYSGAIPEYFKQDEGTVIIAEKDSTALTAAITKFLTDQKYRALMSRLGRRYIEKNFNVQKNIAAIEKLLLGLINK